LCQQLGMANSRQFHMSIRPRADRALVRVGGRAQACHDQCIIWTLIDVDTSMHRPTGTRFDGVCSAMTTSASAGSEESRDFHVWCAELEVDRYPGRPGI
jgi:hypothetical protein